MKSRLLFGLALTSVALFSAASARAASPFSANDLILCFESTGGTGASTDLEIDLGNFQTLNLMSSGSLNILSALTSTYGSSWATDGDVNWAVIGANSISQSLPGSTVYLTDDTGDSLNPQPISQQHGAAVDVFDVYAAVGGTTLSGSSASLTGVTIANNSSDSFTVNYDESGNTGTGIADNEGTGFIEENLDGSNSLSDLFQVVPQDNSGDGGSVTDLDTFTLETNGVLLAQNNAVPEPSTWASLAIGAAALVGLRFRRRRAC